MVRLAAFICSLCLALPALAADYAKPERQERFGEVTVHYSAFTSSTLQPDIAAAAGLVRSKNQGVLNVAVIKAGKPSLASVSGSMKDLTGRERTLVFKQIVEQGAIYYLAQYPIDHEETVTFSLNVQASGSAAQMFSFDQQIFPGE